MRTKFLMLFCFFLNKFMEIVVSDLKIFLNIFSIKYILLTKSKHNYETPGPSQAVEKRSVLCERLHEGLAAVVDGEGGDL